MSDTSNPPQSDTTSNSELPNWVCIPDDDNSHLTTYVVKDELGFGGCLTHEIAGGCTIPQQELANLIAQEANKAIITSRIDTLKELSDVEPIRLSSHIVNALYQTEAQLKAQNRSNDE